MSSSETEEGKTRAHKEAENMWLGRQRLERYARKPRWRNATSGWKRPGRILLEPPKGSVALKTPGAPALGRQDCERIKPPCLLSFVLAGPTKPICEMAPKSWKTQGTEDPLVNWEGTPNMALCDHGFPKVFW